MKKVLFVLTGLFIGFILAELSLRAVYFLAERKVLGLTPPRTTLKMESLN